MGGVVGEGDPREAGGLDPVARVEQGAGAGQIRVESRLGEGASFVVRLPEVAPSREVV